MTEAGTITMGDISIRLLTDWLRGFQAAPGCHQDKRERREHSQPPQSLRESPHDCLLVTVAR